MAKKTGRAISVYITARVGDRLETHTVNDWSMITGLSPNAINGRLYRKKNGADMSNEAIVGLEQPKRKRKGSKDPDMPIPGLCQLARRGLL